MFDGPGITPVVCLAPFIAVISAFLVYCLSYIIGALIKIKTGQRPEWLEAITILLIAAILPLACIASIAFGGAHSPLP